MNRNEDVMSYFGACRRVVVAGVCLAVVLACCTYARAAAPAFPQLSSAESVTGELVEADFIHRTGAIRSSEGKLTRFAMPPYAILTYRGTESDLRDVPLGVKLEFLLLPDEDGEPTRLVGTKPDRAKQDGAVDTEQRKRFVDFTKDRGVAGWIDETTDDTVTITFFSGNPELFDATWAADFQPGQEMRVCVANDELRTWQPTSCGERGTVVEMKSTPIEGFGSSGRRITIKMNNMLEGFRPGRVVRVFGSDWKIRNQNFQECLINYGYMQRGLPDFRECTAKHYPEQFPYRTDYGNRELAWFRPEEGFAPPMYSEHVMYGDLIAVDESGRGGEFRLEPTGETVKFTMLDTGARRSDIFSLSNNFEAAGVRLADLPLDRRYRFHMFQDPSGRFARCSYISDDYSRAVQNSLTYRVRSLDLEHGRIEVDWQGLPVHNYQKDLETPPPYGRSLLTITSETKIHSGSSDIAPSALKVGDPLRFNRASELPGRATYCAEAWVVDLIDAKSAKKAKADKANPVVPRLDKKLKKLDPR